MDANQLNAELTAVLRSVGRLHLKTVAVMYQQIASAAGLGDDWVAVRLEELAATIEAQASAISKPGLAVVYAQMIRDMKDEYASSSSTLESKPVAAHGDLG